MFSYDKRHGQCGVSNITAQPQESDPAPVPPEATWMAFPRLPPPTLGHRADERQTDQGAPWPHTDHQAGDCRARAEPSGTPRPRPRHQPPPSHPQKTGSLRARLPNTQKCPCAPRPLASFPKVAPHVWNLPTGYRFYCVMGGLCGGCEHSPARVFTCTQGRGRALAGNLGSPFLPPPSDFLPLVPKGSSRNAFPKTVCDTTEGERQRPLRPAPGQQAPSPKAPVSAVGWGGPGAAQGSVARDAGDKKTTKNPSRHPTSSLCTADEKWELVSHDGNYGDSGNKHSSLQWDSTLQPFPPHARPRRRRAQPLSRLSATALPVP